MEPLVARSFDNADETREFDNGRLDLVDVGGSFVGRFTLEPGWRWSEAIRPLAGTDTCQERHLGYVVSGQMRVVMNDGTTGMAGPGDVFRIDPGHDAWTEGDEPVTIVDFAGAAKYATTRS